jgi:hypothetical protein
MNSAIVVEAPTISEPPISPVSSDRRTSISEARPRILLRITENHLARRSQRDATMSPIEQARIEMLFQLLDLKGDGRLRHEQEPRQPW